MVEAPAGGHLYGHTAEAKVAELERGPIQVWIQAFGNDDLLGRGRSVRFVLEVDVVREHRIRCDELGRAETAGSRKIIGIAGTDLGRVGEVRMSGGQWSGVASGDEVQGSGERTGTLGKM